MKTNDSFTKIVLGALAFTNAILMPAFAQLSNPPVTPVLEKVPFPVSDQQDFQIPDRVRLTGWLGTRIAANEANRLVKVDTSRLLEGYRKRPGRQTWDGEHVGKWLHAATLAWVNTGDAALRAKLDETAAELCKCQLADGYLGTYEDAKRWTSWDVWAHKYNLIGLITYMRYTGNVSPLPTCQRMADLLCKTFGEAPGQLDIVPRDHREGRRGSQTSPKPLRARSDGSGFLCRRACHRRARMRRQAATGVFVLRGTAGVCKLTSSHVPP